MKYSSLNGVIVSCNIADVIVRIMSCNIALLCCKFDSRSFFSFLDKKHFIGKRNRRNLTPVGTHGFPIGNGVI